MHKATFYPLDNADSSLITLENGKDILFDFGNEANPDDPNEKRVLLDQELRKYMEGKSKDTFDVVAFSHADADHTKRASEFFYLDHSAAYQGKDRFKIKELWVPAAMIVEPNLVDDALVLRQEARHRLRKGYGIRVFSRPERLKDWLAGEGLKMEDRASLFTDAGKLVPGFSLDTDGAEFFVHSPFAHRQDAATVVDRNGDSLVMQVTFSVSGIKTRLLMMNDIEHEPLDELIDITRFHKRDARLWWDICHLPHHCSAYSLSADKGKTQTEPTPNIDWLYEQRGNGAIMVCSSEPIPAGDTKQPPHFQAANYYKAKLAKVVNGRFVVTMSHPAGASKPKKIEIEIGVGGAKLLLPSSVGGAALSDRTGSRVG